LTKFTPFGDVIWSVSGAAAIHHGTISPAGWHAVASASSNDVVVRDLCPDDFPDIPNSHPFFFEVCWMATSGITTGLPDGTYGPTTAVSRQWMAAFLFRLLGPSVYVPPDEPAFPDVPATHPFFDEIQWMAEAGISTGNADGTFGPTTTVSRQAMAAFMYRAAGEPPFVVPVVSMFSDVPVSHPFYEDIHWMALAGVTTGYPDGTFGPAIAVSRQSMAAFVARLRLVIHL